MFDDKRVIKVYCYCCLFQYFRLLYSTTTVVTLFYINNNYYWGEYYLIETYILLLTIDINNVLYLRLETGKLLKRNVLLDAFNQPLSSMNWARVFLFFYLFSPVTSP